MDGRGDQRPPRSVRPGRPPHQQSQSRSPARPYPEQSQTLQRPLLSHHETARTNVSFQNTERGDRHAALDAHRQRTMPSAYQSQLSPTFDTENADFYDPAKVGRKKSLVRPDREKIEPGHRQWHYRTHAAQAMEGTERMDVLPSTTGNLPQGLRRGRSLLARDQDVHESGLALFKKGTLRRRRLQQQSISSLPSQPPEKKKRGCWNGPGPGGPWMMYCYIVTIWIPPFVLSACGIQTPEQQRAWREKIGLVSVILSLMAGVGFLTFGFTEAVCGKPPNRFHGGAIGDSFIGTGSVVIHGYDYDLSKFNHPPAGPFNGSTNPLLTGDWGVAGNDISFMFQKVNQNCLGLITKANTSTISGNGNSLDWYFPCNVISQTGTSGPNMTGYESSTNCHVSGKARTMLNQMRPEGQVYYTWEDVRNSRRNLAVYESSVLDLNLLQWLSRAQVNYPVLFDSMRQANGTYNKKDLTMMFMRTNQRRLGHCLQDLITIGFIDTKTIGCVASDVVLYLSLVFIIGVVAIRFVMAVMFSWFFSWKLGNFPQETYEQRMQRSAEIENWSNDIYRAAPSDYRPNVGKNGLRTGKQWRKSFLPKHSRFTPSENVLKSRPATAYGMLDSSPSPGWKRSAYTPSLKTPKGTPPDTPSYRQSRSTMSLVEGGRGVFADNPCPFPLQNVVPQPPADWEPFNFPLAHTICLVTAYSESVEGLRTTLDSLATTDFPNSHKLILVIADGIVKGAGNDMTTPDICLSMMKEFVINPSEVEPHSYVAIADGHKRHNMAKVYAGFYDYDDATVERSKQQRVPMVLVAKCGNPLEANEAKPGNRGKRDSQIVLMAFLQKVMFDERMTTFEYEFFNSIWRVTGVSPDRYELVLCVDADTKVFPDSLTRMVSCMVHDEEIMGLCGETKIANKAASFVTMMQVFEYYISHHMTKAFESMFGGVTCLPGCFSMYRIKAPKGDSGYWVPILANPDIVEHYSENVVDTLHKKNLLLLGEDRYLTTLMLKTFPKRKSVFCPQAVCKTVVPDTFHVLLSQRRRWINSTVHNLAELLLVRDLCGTFCFSMQFVVGMELAGTLVLPAAIAFTMYLIIISIIPGGTDTTIPLVLLAFVLGLPGILIVITSRKVAYIGWMLIYLFSLPIWNGILPAYAFWHFDDFSWGQTRKVAGDPGDDHGDKDGEFDSSHIVMKRWAEFERERRWKSGTQSRDSTYERRTDSNRYSMVSNSDTTHQPTNTYDASTMESTTNGGGQRPRYESNAVLMLPAPLAINKPMMASSSSVGISRTSEENYLSDTPSNQRLLPDQYSDSIEMSPPIQQSQRHASPSAQYEPIPRNSLSAQRNLTLSPQPYGYNDGHNPFRSMPTSPVSYDRDVYTPDSSDETVGSRSGGSGGTGNGGAAGRGVRLTDSGPVPGPEGVRRVRRQSNNPGRQRPASQAPPQNRYSRNSGVYNLPPGAAPPQPYPYGGGYN
ncbi:glycosyltransferase family 2 protein [Amanita thiersii Skay4041]|uniref:chitin synthase n=1 Tax=Amanita thiersii Skay4041 TaxID=703135 RepID=A0A2A9NAQ8_9AGAR|nr:glycosyltransferase family 2 protein [Amanita thiersii Skay4041]